MVLEEVSINEIKDRKQLLQATHYSSIELMGQLRCPSASGSVTIYLQKQDDHQAIRRQGLWKTITPSNKVKFEGRERHKNDRLK